MAAAVRGLVPKVGGTGAAAAAARVVQRPLIPSAGKGTSLSARRLFSSTANEDRRVKSFKVDVKCLFNQPDMKVSQLNHKCDMTKSDMKIMRLEIRRLKNDELTSMLQNTSAALAIPVLAWITLKSMTSYIKKSKYYRDLPEDEDIIL